MQGEARRLRQKQVRPPTRRALRFRGSWPAIEKIPDHSVPSKARARWGREVFESLFVRTVAQCVEAGLIDGNKLHVDASFIDADASKESVPT